jgi:hypothetical protein
LRSVLSLATGLQAGPKEQRGIIPLPGLSFQNFTANIEDRIS